jgi:tRNA(Ile)-lysidine synthase
MLDPALLQKDLSVRNWRAGDRYWPVHSKAPKKVKELLQERKVSGAERKLWPVVVSGEEIVWVRGFPAPARLHPRDAAREALVIREMAGPEDLKQ